MQEFAGYVQESQGRQNLMGRLSSSVRQAHTALMLKEADPEFAKQLSYFSDLGDKMSVLERIGARLHGEREVLQAALDDFSVELFHWAANEQVMTQPLQKLANCMENCGHLVKKLVRVLGEGGTVCVCVCKQNSTRQQNLIISTKLVCMHFKLSVTLASLVPDVCMCG